MWSVPGSTLPTTLFRSLIPEDVLFVVDFPRLFTFSTSSGNLYLAHWCDSEGEVDRYIVVPATRHTVEGLKTGLLSAREVLATSTRVYVVDSFEWPGEGLESPADVFENKIASIWRVDFNDLPEDVLPAPGLTLRRANP